MSINLNFSISELIKSDIAIRYNINNMPDLKALDNMLNLIFYCLQPLRNEIKKPIIITSGYRCPNVNKIAGGVLNSQHLEGCAADFKIQGMTIKEIIYFIKKSGIEYDQLINEYDRWVHISFVKNKNRKQIIKL